MNGAACCYIDIIRVLPLAEITANDTEKYYLIGISDRPHNAKSEGMSCDFKDGTVSFSLPSSIRHDKRHEANKYCHAVDGQAIMFSPTLFCCSNSLWKPEDFTFFHYQHKEALHISCKEKEVLEKITSSIKAELEWGVDKYSCRLILRKIEILLIYCKRFYDRQFLTRSDACRCIMSKINATIDKTISANHSAEASAHIVNGIADSLNMSSAYLSDYILFKNGHSMKEYMQLRQMEMAKRMVTETRLSMASIARCLGFKSQPLFTSIFQKVYGLSPNEYRAKT